MRPAAAGSGFALKNGWLPRTATGLWDINSVGRASVDGRAYLVAVVSDGHTTKAKGIATVEAAAKAAVSVFADAADAAGTKDSSDSADAAGSAERAGAAEGAEPSGGADAAAGVATNS